MPFPFVYVCDLLNDLERPHLRPTPLLPQDLEKYNKDKVIYWLRQHRNALNAFSTNCKAVMSMFQPEKQTDRVYGLQAESLELVIARVLSLPQQHYHDLQRWQTEPLRGDLAACVNKVMENVKTMTVRTQAKSVTVEEVDQSLLRIAAFNKSSSPAVQSLTGTWGHADETELLGNLYQRLQGREAKWLTRLILKSYAPINFPEDLEPGAHHSFLPNCVQLKIQFPISAPAPVRQDGTRLTAGIGATDPVIHSPTPPRKAPQPLSSGSEPVATAKRAQATPSTSASQPIASSPAPILTIQHTTLTPLASASCSSASVVEQSPNNHLSTQSRPTLGPISHNITISSPWKSPKSARRSPSPPVTTVGTGSCQMACHICPLSNCIFLLGPCISTVPWITEDLFRWHGCRYMTSVRTLAHPSLQRRSSRTGERFRKIALVESNRTQPTVDFLNEIARLELKRKGKKEWIEVYDWRLLECITKVDQGKKLAFNPWDRCWIGAI